MSKRATILIADRNRHVREFIMREMAAEGYECCVSKNAQEVLNTLMGSESIGMLILDLDLPGVTEMELLKKIELERPALHIIFHSLFSDYIMKQPPRLPGAAFVEKNGNSINQIKKIVFRYLGPILGPVPDTMESGNAIGNCLDFSKKVS